MGEVLPDIMRAIMTIKVGNFETDLNSTTAMDLVKTLMSQFAKRMDLGSPELIDYTDEMVALGYVLSLSNGIEFGEFIDISKAMLIIAFLLGRESTKE